ncbi:MAG: carbohydrate kinase family protein [Acidimicrobiia bacterium]
MIATLGDLLEDIVVRPIVAPEAGTDTPSLIDHRRGGSAANVAAMVSRRGGQARFIGCVGQDARGAALVHELSSDGVDLRVSYSAVEPTGTIVVTIDSLGERSFYTSRGASTQLMDYRPDWLDGVSALHIPAYSFSQEPISLTATTTAINARNRGIQISLDASSTGLLMDMPPDAFHALVRVLEPDVVVANASEAALLGLREGKPQRGAKLTIITRGANATLLIEPDGTTHAVDVEPVDTVIDTTGAGDAFTSGWLMARTAGADIHEATQQGHELAALVLNQTGASIPPLTSASGAEARNAAETSNTK